MKVQPHRYTLIMAVISSLPAGYAFFFPSCLACFFSVAVFCGFFFTSFLGLSAFAMTYPSIVYGRDSQGQDYHWFYSRRM